MKRKAQWLGALVLMLGVLVACADDKQGSVETSPIYGSWSLSGIRDGDTTYDTVMTFQPGKVAVALTCHRPRGMFQTKGDTSARITSETVQTLEARQFGDENCRFTFHVTSVKYRVEGNKLTLEDGKERTVLDRMP